MGIQTKGTTSVEYPCLICISTDICDGAAQLAKDGDTFLGSFGLGEAFDRLLHVGEAEHKRLRIGIEGLEVKHALQLFFSKLGVKNLRALPDIGDNGGILFLGGLGLVGSFETLEKRLLVAVSSKTLFLQLGFDYCDCHDSIMFGIQLSAV